MARHRKVNAGVPWALHGDSQHPYNRVRRMGTPNELSACRVACAWARKSAGYRLAPHALHRPFGFPACAAPGIALGAACAASVSRGRCAEDHIRCAVLVRAYVRRRALVLIGGRHIIVEVVQWLSLVVAR